WDGPYYADHSDLQYNWDLNCIRKLKLNGSEQVLDVGSGDGRATLFLANQLPRGRVLGIDPSLSMIEKAKEQPAKANFTNLEFKHASAAEITEINTYDYVTSFNVFHWIDDPLIALKNIANSLKPGGKVFIFYLPDHGRPRMLWAVQSMMMKPKWKEYFKDYKSHFFTYSPQQMSMWINEAGLLFSRMEIVRVQERFSSSDAFKKWMLPIMQGYLSYLPQESHEEFLTGIFEEYLRVMKLDQGNATFVEHFLEIEAEKPAANG
ncbi:MAG TPA: class I SAM-dependent methyltransferase, partial [Myxococcota bacterium]|nr:class I SAM-dependent methyltransferase [Myxococcota bacterium]